MGSGKTLAADVRLIAATNKNLEAMVKEGRFREDLYFRLRVVEIWMPPLRERSSDIPLLATSFLNEFAKENSKSIGAFEPEAMQALTQYSWPGNVRELKTAIEHAVVLARGGRVSVCDLPPSVHGQRRPLLLASLTAPADPLSVRSGPGTVREAEKEMIVQALKESDGNRTIAARKLGMSRRTLHRKLHSYELEDL